MAWRWFLDTVSPYVQTDSVEQCEDLAVASLDSTWDPCARNDSVTPLAKSAGDDNDVDPTGLSGGADKGHPRGCFYNLDHVPLINCDEHAERDMIQEAWFQAGSGLRILQSFEAGKESLCVSQFSVACITAAGNAVTQCIVSDGQECSEVNRRLLNQYSIDAHCIFQIAGQGVEPCVPGL